MINNGSLKPSRWRPETAGWNATGRNNTGRDPSVLDPLPPSSVSPAFLQVRSSGGGSHLDLPRNILILLLWPTAGLASPSAGQVSRFFLLLGLCA